MLVCEKELCTGCEACRNACPRDCISMAESAEGFLCPDIDGSRCTECDLCRTACPVLNKPELERQPEPTVYACWHSDGSVRRQSTSGGAFSGLAEEVLDHGGLVFGAAYDKQMHVRHIGITESEKLDGLRRSKYVQSEIGLIFQEIKEALGTGKPVLFVGTPCQVAGLYVFVGANHERLITCDLICSGVPSPKVFTKYIAWLESWLQAKVMYLNFRDKRKGWEDPLSLVRDSNEVEHVLIGKKNSYFNGFNMHVFLRECCYACQFNGLPRVSDLTLADYWGIGRRFPFAWKKEKYKGLSLILVNSAEGQAFLSQCKERFILVERQLQEVIDGNSPLHTSVERPLSRDNFFRDIDSVEYDNLIKRYLRPPLKSRMRIFAREMLGGSVLRLLRQVYGKIR